MVSISIFMLLNFSVSSVHPDKLFLFVCFLTLYLGDYLPPRHFFFFLEIFPILSFGFYFLNSPFWLTVFFSCVLGTIVKFPSFWRMIWYSVCFVEPSGSTPCSSELDAPWITPVWVMSALVIIQCWLIWSYLCVRSTIKVADS